MRLPFKACTINGIEKPFLLDKPQKIWFCSRLMRIFDCVLYTFARQNSNKFGSALDLCVYLTASYILSLGRTQINLVLLSTYAYICKMENELKRLNAAIAAKPSAELYLQRGRLLWRMQRHAAAMADYERATALDGPGSAAATALAMARDVMDFYNKDLLNP